MEPTVCFLCRREFDPSERINSQITPFKTCGSLCEDKARFFIELFVTKGLDAPEWPGLLGLAEQVSKGFAAKLENIAANMRLQQLPTYDDMIISHVDELKFRRRLICIEELESNLRNEREFHISKLEESVTRNVTPDKLKKADGLVIHDNDSSLKRSDKKNDDRHYHDDVYEEYREARIAQNALKEGKNSSPILIYNNNQSPSRPIPIPCRNGDKCKYLPNCKYLHIPTNKPQAFQDKYKKYGKPTRRVPSDEPSGFVESAVASSDENQDGSSPISRDMPEVTKNGKELPKFFTERSELIEHGMPTDRKASSSNLLDPSQVTTSPEQKLNIKSKKSTVVVEKDKKSGTTTISGNRQTYTSTATEKDSSPKKETLIQEDIHAIMEDPNAPSSFRNV